MNKGVITCSILAAIIAGFIFVSGIEVDSPVPVQEVSGNFDVNGVQTRGFIVEFDDSPALKEKMTLEKQYGELEKKYQEASFFKKIILVGDRIKMSSLKSKANDLSSYRDELKTKRGKILKDFSKKDISKAAKNAIEKIKETDEFNDVLNGVVLNITQEDAETLSRTEGVSKVYPNYEVNITLMDSVPLINADDAWQIKDSNSNNLTGKGATIAIIDTGVDYTHSDLGGCFGTNCKVTGGYDFVNNEHEVNP